MRKPLFILLLTLILALICSLAACKSKPPEEPPAGAPEAAALAEPANLQRLTLATGATSGNYYPFGNVLAQVVDDATGYIKLEVSATTASAENIALLASGEAQLAIVQNDVLNYAFHGINIWAGKPSVTTTRTLMTLYPEVCQLVVAADSGIESVAGLVGKRVAIGEPDSALAVGARQILAACNVAAEDVQIQNIGFGAAAEAMKGRTIDAFFVTVGTPNKGIMDLQAERDIRIISLDEAVIDSLIEKYPFYTKATLDENDYSFLAEPVNTVAVRSTLATTSSLDEQTAYDIVKAIIEGQDKIAIAHAKGSFINAEAAVSGLGVELHPGARRYFQEIGVL